MDGWVWVGFGRRVGGREEGWMDGWREGEMGG